MIEIESERAKSNISNKYENKKTISLNIFQQENDHDFRRLEGARSTMEAVLISALTATTRLEFYKVENIELAFSHLVKHKYQVGL